MANSNNTTPGSVQGGAQATVPNGQYFRVPKYSAQKRFLQDGNNRQIVTTLNAGQQTTALTTAIDRLDIVRALQVEIDVSQTYTGGTTPVTSPFYPYNIIGDIELQFESAYKSFRAPGWLAAVFQQYRPAFSYGPVAPLVNSGSNVQTAGQPSTAYQQPNLLVGTGNAQTTTNIPLIFEIPVAQYFDLYYELDLQGNPLAAIPRAFVSPQYMAATTRSVTPTLVYNSQALLAGAGNALNSSVTFATAPTYAGTATAKFRRDGWFPASTASTPPVYGWQYSRDYFTYPITGQNQITIPLDTSTVGQGQILSVVCMVFDPASGPSGAVVPVSNYSEIDLSFGSNLILRQDTATSMQYNWLNQHGQLPPAGIVGYDLALQENGMITNEFALNTLTTSGVQLRLNFGTAPSTSAVAYIGLEMLRAVSS